MLVYRDDVEGDLDFSLQTFQRDGDTELSPIAWEMVSMHILF